MSIGPLEYWMPKTGYAQVKNFLIPITKTKPNFDHKKKDPLKKVLILSTDTDTDTRYRYLSCTSTDADTNWIFLTDADTDIKISVSVYIIMS